MAFLLVAVGRYFEGGVDHKFRESHGTVRAFELAFRMTLDRCPREPGSPGDGSEAQDKAVGDRRDQQGLRGPPIAGTAKLRGRGGQYGLYGLGGHVNVALRFSLGRHPIKMRKVLHRESPGVFQWCMQSGQSRALFRIP
jgi:hypothetical protein